MTEVKNTGKAVSMLCFLSGLLFILAGGIVALACGTVDRDWVGIVGIGATISQLPLPVNISKIIQNLRGSENKGREL